MKGFTTTKQLFVGASALLITLLAGTIAGARNEIMLGPNGGQIQLLAHFEVNNAD
jgi:hypothetical protein